MLYHNMLVSACTAPWPHCQLGPNTRIVEFFNGAFRGQNKSSPKSYAKAERSMNNAVVLILDVRSLWIAIDIRWF